jgi:hypothetical protein
VSEAGAGAVTSVELHEHDAVRWDTLAGHMPGGVRVAVSRAVCDPARRR